MSDLFLANSTDLFSYGGGDTPDPVSMSTPSYTWSVRWNADPTLLTYARTSLNSLMDLGGGYVFSGIVRYVTQNADGSFTFNNVGITNPSGFFDGGVTDFIQGTSVFDITFGWGIGSSGGLALFTANINMEIWFTDWENELGGGD
jgi:hypothetical protein